MKARILLTITALLFAFSSCRQPEEIPSSEKHFPIDDPRDITLTVTDPEWEESGIDGKYPLGAFYRNWKDSRVYGPSFGPDAIVPERTASLTYKLSIPKDCASQGYKWYAVSPYYPNIFNALSRKDLRVSVYPVQYPGATGVDPLFELRASKPFDAGVTSGEIKAFDRLTARLKLNVSGLKADEKMYAVSVGLGQALSADNALAGVNDVSLPKEEGELAVSVADEASNKVTALFAEGQAAGAVNYAVNPMTIANGTPVTVSVTTADSTFVRTISLDGEKNLTVGNTLEISCDIRGEGYSTAETSFVDFDTDEVYPGEPRCLETTPEGKTYTIPKIKGASVFAVTIFGHVQNTVATDNAVNVMNEGKAIATVEMGADGTLELDLNNVPVTNLNGLTLQPVGDSLYFNAALIYAEKKQVDMNDYLDMFNNEIDFVIGGKVINKENCGSAFVNVKPANLTTDELKKSHSNGGVLFLDNSDEASNSFVVNTSSTLTFGESRIVIGRYRNMPQPEILLTLPAKAAKYFYVSGEMRFLNVKLGALNTTYGSFVNSGAGSSKRLSVSCQDCTYYTDVFGMFRFGNDNNGFSEIIVDNCIIRCQNNLINSSSAGLPQAPTLEKISITNTAITTYNGATKAGFGIVNLNTEMPALEIVFSGNTIYGTSSTNGLFYFKKVKSLTMENNLFWDELGAGTALVKSSVTGGTLTLENNYGNKISGFNWTPGTTDKFSTYNAAVKGNLASEEKFFGSGMSVAEGYFPSLIDGVGCRYDTKNWIKK